MSASGARVTGREMVNSAISGRLFFLDIGSGRVLSVNPDGSDLKTIVNEGRKFPDGLVVDAEGDCLYWTNMGNPQATTAPF